MLEKLVYKLGEWKIVYYEEPSEEDEDDPVLAYKTQTYQVIRSAFDLVNSDDGHVKINVDNVCPLLRTLGLNTNDDLVMDMVREACMESTGDIEPHKFDEVVLTLIKRLDEELWIKRLEEKEEQRHEYEAKKASKEVEKLQKAEERRKAGFKEDEAEKEDEWNQYERQKREEADRKREEQKCDDLYDNIKMAFRFIDADGDGVITTKDLYTLMMGLGEMLTDDDLFGMFTMADINCDGKVTLDDFKRFLMPDSETEGEQPGKTGNQTDNTIQNTSASAKPSELIKDGDSDISSVTESTSVQLDATSDSTQGKEVTSRFSSVSTESPACHPAPERSASRSSILRGYTKAVIRLTSEISQSESDISSPPLESPILPTLEITAEENDEIDHKRSDDLADGAEPFNHLNAIREEDEHSNYELQHNENNHAKAVEVNAASVSSALENKRKHFTRQGSATSLKTRPNSALTCDSICDSGIDTMDNLYGSEIREQPDMFDLSDEEIIGDLHNTTPRGSNEKNNETLPHESVYEINEDDEDMVEARHVHDSLSRVSSPDLCEENGNIQTMPLSVEVNRTPLKNSVLVVKGLSDADAVESVERANCSDERLAKAKSLQRLISNRPLTSPRLTCYTSKSPRPLSKSDLPVPVCSQIDINLTCEAPPKGDVRAFRKDTQQRNQSAKCARHYNNARNDQLMAVIDVGDSMDEPSKAHLDLPRFPSRPLTRPRSPRRPVSARAVKGRINVESLSIDVRPIGFGNKTPKRCQSAVPLTRTPSAPKMLVRARRPQTAHANIPYTGSRRMEEAFAKLNASENTKVVHPYVEQEYPNKAVLTTLHHGFKTFWPIGRNVNVIKEKRPFKAFELNSYSRSIERNCFPFKGMSSVNASIDGEDDLKQNEDELVKITSQSMKHINLDLDIHEPVVSRPRSAFVGNRRMPNTVR